MIEVIAVGYALVTGLTFSVLTSRAEYGLTIGEVVLLFVCALLWPLTVLAIGIGRMIRSDDY